MADFNIQISEKITLNSAPRTVYTDQTISGINSGINYIDNRILLAPSGSTTTIFSFGSANSAGTFTTGSFKYGRITNQSAVVPIKLIVSSSTEAMSYLVDPSSTFMLSTGKMTSNLNLTAAWDSIASVKIVPSGSTDVSIEYFIATT